MQQDRGSYQQAPRDDAAQREDVELSLKRFILNQAMDFEREPMADLYRVGLLAQMLDRYDVLRAQGLSSENALRRAQYEFRDIPRRMREEGFNELDAPRRTASSSRWPELTEDDAAQYIKESNDYLHRKAIGTALCAGCVAPLMLSIGISELFWGVGDLWAMMGMVGMFGMIGMGVYSMTTAVKPKRQEQIKKRRFSLSNRLRKKLNDLRELTEHKTRRRRGKGIALLVTCVAPLFLGAGLSSIWYGDFWPMIGLAGMFLMIGMGVYELTMGEAEKKVVQRLLKGKEET